MHTVSPAPGPDRCPPPSSRQVEHGITEMVHGNVDIVEWQLRLQVPGLEALDLSREMPVAKGCAIEVGRCTLHAARWRFCCCACACCLLSWRECWHAASCGAAQQAHMLTAMGWHLLDLHKPRACGQKHVHDLHALTCPLPVAHLPPS
jgi:hypothetical protein